MYNNVYISEISSPIINQMQDYRNSVTFLGIVGLLHDSLSYCCVELTTPKDGDEDDDDGSFLLILYRLHEIIIYCFTMHIPFINLVCI